MGHTYIMRTLSVINVHINFLVFVHIHVLASVSETGFQNQFVKTQSDISGHLKKPLEGKKIYLHKDRLRKTKYMQKW